MPAPNVSEDTLGDYAAAVDSPPPLPLSLGEARRQGYIQPFLTETENRGTKRLILIIRKANEN